MITVDNLRFSYTREPFIEDVSFVVGRGEIFGFLGPSGAGKSTLQKILTGFLKNYEGRVTVGGIEMKQADKSFYERIGIDFEFPSLYERLTGTENLKFFGSLYSGDKIPVADLIDADSWSQAATSSVYGDGSEGGYTTIVSYTANAGSAGTGITVKPNGGDTGKTLFFSNASFRHYNDGAVNSYGQQGFYWSAELRTTNTSNAWYLSFGDSSGRTDASNKLFAMSIHCVRS